MDETTRIKYLRLALRAVGVIFIVGIYSLVMYLAVWLVVALGTITPFAHYLQMVLGVYATWVFFCCSRAVTHSQT